MLPPAIVFFESLLPYGLTCLACHTLLWATFRYVLPSSGPWRASPNFTAHQVVALFLMIQWTYYGFFGKEEEGEVSNEHDLPIVLRPSPFGMKMAQRSMAALWIWDIPVSMLSSDMHSAMDALMHAHHMGMLLVTCVVMGWLTFGTPSEAYPHPVGASLAPLFFGQIELSSIPLQIVDLFHPKKSPAWHQYLTDRPALAAINDACRQLFALLFLAVRGVYFPYLVFHNRHSRILGCSRLEHDARPIQVYFAHCDNFGIFHCLYSIANVLGRVGAESSVQGIEGRREQGEEEIGNSSVMEAKGKIASEPKKSIVYHVSFKEGSSANEI
jgi:hypothetical protein